MTKIITAFLFSGMIATEEKEMGAKIAVVGSSQQFYYSLGFIPYRMMKPLKERPVEKIGGRIIDKWIINVHN